VKDKMKIMKKTQKDRKGQSL